MGNLALILNATDDHEAAEALQRRTVALSFKVLGEEHPDTLTHRNNWAGILAARRRFTEANELFQSVLDAFDRCLGNDHHLTQGCRQNFDSMKMKSAVEHP